VPMVRFTT
jgi:hypothetical protein